jgi:hypothetical protein
MILRIQPISLASGRISYPQRGQEYFPQLETSGQEVQPLVEQDGSKSKPQKSQWTITHPIR